MTATAPTNAICVDLDGTLLRSDMLHESFWSALGRDWATPLGAGRALAGGRAALKHYLSQVAAVDVTSRTKEFAKVQEVSPAF